jgi:hypothetical protein
MPWCPRCDETFPEGPACPRCSARLIARERDSHEDTLHTVPGLRAIKVSRRYLRAFERLSAPRASSSRALALALVLLVFATGFLLGRVGSVPQAQPTVHALPVAEPLAFEDVNGPVIKGAVAYLLSSRDRVATVAQHHLYSGEVMPLARFSSPFDTEEDQTSKAVSFGRSVALVVSDGSHQRIAFAPHRLAPQGWIPGEQAAWTSEHELVVRNADDRLTRWTASDGGLDVDQLGRADELFQTASGAVVRRGRVLETISGPTRRLDLPAKRAEVVAIAPDVSRVVLDADRPELWDGEERRPIHAYAGRVIGAAYERSGERVALLMIEKDELMLAIVMPRGNAALKPIGEGKACRTAPAWDDQGRWLYVGTADGALRAIEAGGGRVETVRTHGVGCGLAWLDIT